MPRQDGEQLRESILERLEQVSVLLLLPVFFVVSGLSVDLSKIDGRLLVELLGILGVAIGGKFIGAYAGARAAGVNSRHAGVLATLMNTRGLTEIVILTVGLQLGVLDKSLFSLMVLMALITTAMTGPMLRAVYPPRLVQRDLADAERAALAETNAYRVLVILESEQDVELVDLGIDIAAGRRPSEVVLSLLVPQRPDARLEVGTGLGAELLTMTRTMAALHALAARATARSVGVSVYSQFSENITADLTRHVIAADADLVLRPAGVTLQAHPLMPRTVTRAPNATSGAMVVAVRVADGGADTAVALQVATQIAVGTGAALVLIGAAGRREREVLAELSKHGIDAHSGDAPEDALIVGTTGSPGVAIVARARPDDEIDHIEEWASLVSAERQP